MDGACSMNAEKRMPQDIGGKARRKETTGKKKRRLVDNIKMDLR
jgi:hypothetical protein